MKVLIIEEPKWSNQEEVTETLKNHKQIQLDFCDFGHALSVMTNFEIDVCVVDSCFGPDRQISTVSLVSQIRKNFFKGKMVVISNTAPSSRIPFRLAGCEFECAKGRLAELLIRLSQQSSENHTGKNICAFV